MAAEVKPRTLEAVLPARRRVHRDAPTPEKVDKARVLAHLQGLLAQVRESEEVAHGDA